MVGKNNHEVQLKRSANKVKRYAIKRTSVGVVSAVVAAGLFFSPDNSVKADEITETEALVTEMASEETAEVTESETVGESADAETSQVELVVVDESEATSEFYTEEASVEPVYEASAVVSEEASIESAYEETLSVTEDSAVESDERPAEVSTVESTEEAIEGEVADEKAVIFETEVSEVESATDQEGVKEEALEITEQTENAQPQMRTFEISTTATNIGESDTRLPGAIAAPAERKEYTTLKNVFGPFDFDSPKLKDIYTDKKKYQAGEDIKVTAIVEEASELEYLSVMFDKISESVSGPGYLVANNRNNESTIQQENGNHLIELIIETNPNIPSNTYSLLDIELRDSNGNNIILNSYDIKNNSFDLTIDINNENGDEIFPKILSISTDKTIYQAGEDIKVTALVKENIDLDNIGVEFYKVGDEIQINSLLGSASKERMTIVPLEDGNFLAEIVIETKEISPKTLYVLDNVSLEDTARNSVRAGIRELNPGMEDLFISVLPANLPYETVYELNLDLSPESPNFIVQEGINGLRDEFTGEVINAPVSEIIQYAPVKIPFETVQVENDDLYVGDSSVTYGEYGLLDPRTNEVVLAPVNEIIEIGTKVKPKPEEIPFETERILDINLTGPYERVGQMGQVGYRDAETGEIISEPTNMIIYYPPVADYYETERIFNPEKTPDSEVSMIQKGVVGLIDPETNQVIVEKVPQIIEFGPVTIDYYTHYRTSLSLEPNSDEELVAQEGERGLRNPLTWEVIKEPVSEIIVEGPTENEEPTIRNVITLIDKSSNEEIATTEFIGNYYSNRLSYLIRQINSQQGIELETEEEEITSITRNSTTIDGYRASLITYRKNVYVTDYSKPNVNKPLVPDRVIYSDLDYGTAYREITILDEYGQIKYVRDYLSEESTDESIKEALMYFSDYGYHFDRVEVNEIVSSMYNNGDYYTGPVKEIVIHVKENQVPINEELELPEVEEPATPVEPEVPIVEEPEIPVEPEVPAVEEPTTPETPAEPEVPVVEEPEIPAEPEVPVEEEPETPAEPEVPVVEEPEAPVEPEVPVAEEPETPAEPEVPVVEEPEAPVEPEVPVAEEPATPVEPEVPVVEESDTPVEPEVPTTDVETPVITPEENVVVTAPIATPVQAVATEESETESKVVVANTDPDTAEKSLPAETMDEAPVVNANDDVDTLPAAGAQTVSALATGLGLVTTALGAALVRKKK